jgi:hypothetical protein
MRNFLLALFTITFLAANEFAAASNWDSVYSKKGWEKTGRYYECNGIDGATNRSVYLAIYEVISPSDKIGFYSFAKDVYVDEGIFDPDETGSIQQHGENLILENPWIRIRLSRESATYTMPANQRTGGSRYEVYYRCAGHGIPRPGPF